MATVFTIGHSNHPPEKFAALLAMHRITGVADVRSAPYSRANPHFNREPLAARLKGSGIAYVYLGRELGGRTDDPDCYDEAGRIRYDRVANTQRFRDGLQRIASGAARFSIALMCAEKQPERCHRALLVAQALDEQGVEVRHIKADGETESHNDMVDRLIATLGLNPDDDLLRRTQPRDELVDEAILRQTRLVDTHWHPAFEPRLSFSCSRVGAVGTNRP